MVEKTRLCIGGPFDKKYVRFTIHDGESCRTVYQLVEPEATEPKVIPCYTPELYNRKMKYKVHYYYPSDFYYNGVETQIVMRHEYIEEKNLWSYILKGYAQNCLQQK